MIRYLLDSGPVSAVLMARPGATTLVLPWIQARIVSTSILVYGEVAEYVAGRPDASVRLRALRDLLGEVTPLDITLAIMDRYAEVRRQLRTPYGPGLIGDIDTLIAATAIQHGLTLVTLDSDFRRIPNLDSLLLAKRSFTPIQ